MPAKRPGRRHSVQPKVAERIHISNAQAMERYRVFVEPFLPELEKMAKARAGRDKWLSERMLSWAITKVIAGAKIGSVKKPKHFTLKVAKNAMVEIIRTEIYDRKLVQTKPFEAFLKMVDQRAGVEIRDSDAFEAVSSLLEKIKAAPEIKATFAYHYRLNEPIQSKNFRFRTLNETAKHFGVTLQTVKSRLDAVKKRLRWSAGLKPEPRKKK
ncbi:MAG: hypothetical protein JW744_05065 [Candidatus Diapherotrites archaeon]|uniref:Uncharacterized protein n=1 Tax=Candidatus Iainarchaeum sp. TaxID=3101447 RepID=A0A938YY40_9ARCH|nr:hypothetical protein [Candidatus Diapherotrites archaeon]